MPFKVSLHFIFILLTTLVHPNFSWTQVLVNGAQYRSEVDDFLTIHHITLLPVVDNVSGIYSEPVEKKLKELLLSNHRWSFVENNLVGNIPSDHELEESPEDVRRLGQTMGVEAYLTARVNKGPKGIAVTLSLFSTKDGKLLIQESVKEFARFETHAVEDEVSRLLTKLMGKIPYDGRILSRRGLQVTINLGKIDGVKQDDVLAVIQIIKLNRHPKFNFLISTEKEIIGKVKIYKVDETMSFGGIIWEKEKGVVEKNAKIGKLGSVTYSNAEALGNEATEQEILEDRPDAQMAFGENPDAWIPRKPPSYGQVGFNLGIGNFSAKMNPAVTGDIELNTNLFAGIGLMGELWLNNEWITRAEIKQNVFSASNPISGSTPAKLSVSLQNYSLIFGYNLLLEEDFFSSKIEIRGGFANYTFGVDDTNPRGFSSVSYSGPLFGIKGQFPITKDRVWYAGMDLNLFINPVISQKPIAAGAGDHNTINEYNFFISKMVTNHLYLDGSVNLSLYRTQFDLQSSDRGSDSATQMSFTNTFYNIGFRYQF